MKRQWAVQKRQCSSSHRGRRCLRVLHHQHARGRVRGPRHRPDWRRRGGRPGDVAEVLLDQGERLGRIEVPDCSAAPR